MGTDQHRFPALRRGYPRPGKNCSCHSDPDTLAPAALTRATGTVPPLTTAPAAGVGPSSPSVARLAMAASGQSPSEIAAARAISWFRPPYPSPCKVTVVSPPKIRHLSGDVSLAICAAIRPISRASPSSSTVTIWASNPSSSALASAASAACFTSPTIKISLAGAAPAWLSSDRSRASVTRL